MALQSEITDKVIFQKSDLVNAIKDYLKKQNVKGNIDSITSMFFGEVTGSAFDQMEETELVLTVTMDIT